VRVQGEGEGEGEGEAAGCRLQAAGYRLLVTVKLAARPPSAATVR
jgi:hypothetical protein